MTATPTRLRHVDDGWLLARDLRDEPRLDAARLAQHHIAAHDTWGVSAGLDVDAGRGRLEVGPGLAVDRCGRIGILSELFHVRLADAGLDGRAFVVVLAIIGDGPRACVRLREPSGVRDSDVPLASVDEKGTAWSGDGHRQWLRRPGPVRTHSGIVPRGRPLVAGPPHATRLAWSVHVDLTDHRLDGIPAVVASAAALAPGGPPVAAVSTPTGAVALIVFATTLDVHDVSRVGFDITVRHHVPPVDALLGAQSDARTQPEIRTSPMPIAWMALLPAERPAVPLPLQDSL